MPIPTPPFSVATAAKLQARQQSVRFTAVLAEVRQFRAYCCNISSADIMGVSKQPVAVLSISPNPVCLGEAISWSFVGSYAPGSTITSRSINFGDGNSSNPAAVSGTHTYAAAGSYTVSATVTEGLGTTQTVEVEVNVIDCTDAIVLGYAYIATDGGGVYYRDFTASVPAWTAKNDGLSGNALNVNYMVMRPGDKHKPADVQELLIATDDGLYRTKNGGTGWEKLILPDPSDAEFASPAVSAIAFDWVDYSLLDLDTIFARGVYAASSQMWIYKSTDAGGTWSSRGVIAT